MICGRYQHPPSACFDEVDIAVAQLDVFASRRVVAFNAHMFRAPEGAVIFNTENLPAQVPDWKERYAGHELWDMSARNCALTGATHVPIGYHPSMTRFSRAHIPDIDVVFTGCLNARRSHVLDELTDRGYSVVVIPSGGSYGAARDAVLARSRLAINMLYYEDGIFPALRVAHLVANRVPVLSERCAEGWEIVPTVLYGGLVDRAIAMLQGADLDDAAEAALDAFKKMPMRLPT